MPRRWRAHGLGARADSRDQITGGGPRHPARRSRNHYYSDPTRCRYPQSPLASAKRLCDHGLGARVASWTRQSAIHVTQLTARAATTSPTHVGVDPQCRVSPSRFTMNADELFECAPRLSDSHRAYVILNDGGRGVIVPPGVFGKNITLRACDAKGRQSGPVKKVSPKELRLEPLPAPPAPLRLAPWCVNCGSPAMLRCLSLIHI